MISREPLTKSLTVLSCVAAALPYAFIFYGKGRNFEALLFMGSGIWLAAVLTTQIVGGWARSLRWLWLLFPIAFGPQLFLLLMFVIITLFGFAP